jgi:hypothetical protein
MLIELKKAVMNEQFIRSTDLDRYLKQIDQISIATNGLLLRNNRIIVPKSLKQKVVDIGHNGHLGMNKTKSLLRSYVWFIGLDSLVELTVRKCRLRPTKHIKNHFQQQISHTNHGIKGSTAFHRMYFIVQLNIIVKNIILSYYTSYYRTT